MFSLRYSAYAGKRLNTGTRSAMRSSACVRRLHWLGTASSSKTARSLGLIFSAYNKKKVSAENRCGGTAIRRGSVGSLNNKKQPQLPARRRVFLRRPLRPKSSMLPSLVCCDEASGAQVLSPPVHDLGARAGKALPRYRSARSRASSLLQTECLRKVCFHRRLPRPEERGEQSVSCEEGETYIVNATEKQRAT